MAHPFDRLVPDPLPDTGRTGAAAEVTPFAEAQTRSPSPPHTDIHFRLIEIGRPGQRNIDHPELYLDVQEAVAVAHRILDRLAAKPHRRPRLINVYDVWTGEIMARVRPDDDRDDTICPTCGQPRDPFA